jgi:hypothetical protein
MVTFMHCHHGHDDQPEEPAERQQWLTGRSHPEEDGARHSPEHQGSPHPPIGSDVVGDGA